MLRKLVLAVFALALLSTALVPYQAYAGRTYENNEAAVLLCQAYAQKNGYAVNDYTGWFDPSPTMSTSGVQCRNVYGTDHVPLGNFQSMLTPYADGACQIAGYDYGDLEYEKATDLGNILKAVTSKKIDAIEEIELTCENNSSWWWW